MQLNLKKYLYLYTQPYNLIKTKIRSTISITFTEQEDIVLLKLIFKFAF